MTPEPPPEPPPELVMTRVGGGRSARLTAVLVVIVLIGVIGFAVLGRPPAPNPTVGAAPSSSSAPPTAQAADSTTQPEAVSSPRPIYGYAVSATISGGSIQVALEHDRGEALSGSLGFSTADVGSEVRVALSREWTSNGQQIVEPFDAWGITLRPLRRRGGRVVDLLTAYDLRTQGSASSMPMPAGYTFTVRGRRVGTQIELYFEFVWPTATTR